MDDWRRFQAKLPRIFLPLSRLNHALSDSSATIHTTNLLTEREKILFFPFSKIELRDYGISPTYKLFSDPRKIFPPEFFPRFQNGIVSAAKIFSDVFFRLQDAFDLNSLNRGLRNCRWKPCCSRKASTQVYLAQPRPT